MKIVLAALILLGVAACSAVQPEHQTGAANVPATQGGGAGPQEGSPLSARNLGSGPTATVAQ